MGINDSIIEVFICFFNERATELHIALSYGFHRHSVRIVAKLASLNDVRIHLDHVLRRIVFQQLSEGQLKYSPLDASVMRECIVPFFRPASQCYFSNMHVIRIRIHCASALGLQA